MLKKQKMSQQETNNKDLLAKLEITAKKVSEQIKEANKSAKEVQKIANKMGYFVDFETGKVKKTGY